MNPIAGVSSPSALPEMAGAAIPNHSTSPWTGLRREAARIGVPLDPQALARFDRYRDLLIERNAQFNLTAIRDPVEVERRLFLDALAMLPAIDAFVHGKQPCAASVRLIDVGSGAGFPGLPLKIARPELDVTLLDATRKKVGFLEDVIAALGLPSIRALHGRAEDLGHDTAFRERFDMATARAVAALPTLLELTVPFLDVGGRAFLPKGLDIAEELRSGGRAACKLGAEIVSADIAPTGESRLVIVEKQRLTAPLYPRRAGLPNQSPLGAKD